MFLALSLAECRTQTKTQNSFAFGIVADIQYADKESNGARHYRIPFDRLKACVAKLNQCGRAFTIQLGDLLDGNKTSEGTLADLDKILGVNHTLNMPAYNVIGNHCLTAGKEHLQQKLELDRFYYDFTVRATPGWRFIVLDGNEAGNGMLGQTQLEWQKTSIQKEKVIVFCHFPQLEDAAPSCRMQEPEPVLQLINTSGCVVAYFAGHDHAGGYACRNGIHPVTLKGMVGAPEQNACAITEAHPDHLLETGFGTEPCRLLDIGQD